MADWQKIKTEYISTKTSYRKLAEKYGVHYKKIADMGKKENWEKLRSQVAHKVPTKTVSRVSTAQADSASKLMSAANELLGKTEAMLRSINPDDMDTTSLKDISVVLKNAKEILMIKSQKDLEEQDARIAKLRKDAEREEQNHDVTITIEGGDASWQS